MSALRWWRVEVDERGNVLACGSVAGPGAKGARLFYIEAASVKDAKRLGKAAFNEYCRTKVRATRARLAAEGLCRCGAKRLPGLKKCEKCRRQDNASHKRHYRRSKGEVVVAPNRFETVAANREAASRARRLEILQEVQSAFVREPGAFARWLQAEILKLAGKSAA
jgi:hypothetical protein